MNFVALLFHLLPKNLISFITGVVVRVELPRPLSTWVCRGFAGVFKLNMAEAVLPVTSFKSIEDVFVRALKPGLRPMATPIGSPADGYLARSAPADKGTAVQAKGLFYSLPVLVAGDGATAGTAPKAEDLAWYQTIYLAPHNYHRVHAPFSGVVTAVRYLPGMLWPVNVPFVARIPRLFNRNERLVFDFQLTTGGRAWVVMVGAFNVGRMMTPLAPEIVTNGSDRQLGPKVQDISMTRNVTGGDELGTFMLGSTVILVYDKRAIDGLAPRHVFQAEGNGPILMGQTLTRGDRHD